MKLLVKVVFQTADLDTCLAGAILGITAVDDVVHRPHGAQREELSDPTVVCLEAGGSGDALLGNFDHHDTDLPLPPAATQVFHWLGRPPRFDRLVEYTELVDLGQRFRAPAFPSVSHLISGLRFAHAADSVTQFRRGVEVLVQIADLGLDPFENLPFREEWAPY